MQKLLERGFLTAGLLRASNGIIMNLQEGGWFTDLLNHKTLFVTRHTLAFCRSNVCATKFET